MDKIIPLSREADNVVQNVMPKRLDRALSWLKSACKQSSDALQCHICYTNLDSLMVLIMLSGKLITLSKSLLRHTLNMSNFQRPAKLQDYKIGEPDEMATVFRLLCGHQVVAISELLSTIKRSPALEGRRDESIMIQNMDQQVVKTLAGVKTSVITSLQ